MDRALGLASVGVGLLATVVLAVAVSVDYWLYTNEPMDTGLMAGGGGGGQAVTPPPADGETAAVDGPSSSVVTMFTTNSGLWRACIYPTVHPGDEDYDELMADRSCSFIAYFGQSYERVDSGPTSASILREIRKATPVIIVSFAVMLVAQVVNIVGYLRKDYRTIVGAVLSIISALGLALGHIFYISAVNDEVSQWKRPENATDDQVMTYQYGWAFYAAGSAFVFLMVAAVGNVTVFVRRYYVKNDVRRILTVVPGLESKMAATGSDQNDDQPEVVVGVDVDATVRHTPGTSNSAF